MAAAVDPVERALAVALERASEAGEWSTAQLLARELEARRRARQAPDVPDLEDERDPDAAPGVGAVVRMR